MDRDIGHLRADFDQRDTQVAFLASEAGIGRRQRAGDHAFDIEMRGLHRFDQIADGRTFGQRDMDIDPERLGMEALGIGDAMRPVERVMRRLRMQHHASVGVQVVARGIEQVLDVVFLDPAPADGDLDTGNLARQPRPSTADPHALDRGVGIRLGLLDRSADRMAGRAHIGDIAALDPVAGAVARTEYDHLAAFGLAHDHGRNAKRPDVHGAEDTGDAWLLGGHYSAFPLSAICLGHGPSAQRR